MLANDNSLAYRNTPGVCKSSLTKNIVLHWILQTHHNIKTLKLVQIKTNNIDLKVY